MQGKEFAQRTSRREGSQEVFMFILGKKRKKTTQQLGGFCLCKNLQVNKKRIESHNRKVWGLSLGILQGLQSPESPAGEVLGQVREYALLLHFSLAIPFFKVN